MMLDTIENSALYESINPLFKKAFDYLKHTDFSALELGKHSIEGELLFAIVQEYDTKNDADARLEAHKKYIDIQYMIEGDELMGHTLYSGHNTCKEYDAENDYALYDYPCSFARVGAGQFTVFFPHDLHKPGIKVDATAKVRKVVLKVRV